MGVGRRAKLFGLFPPDILISPIPTRMTTYGGVGRSHLRERESPCVQPMNGGSACGHC